MRQMLFIPVGEDFSMVEAADLDEIRAHIGGYVERVRVAEEWALAVNEEGRIRGLPLNPLASLLYGIIRHGQPICGPALLGREGFVGDGVDWVSSSQEEVHAFLCSRLPAAFSSRFST